MKYLIIFEAPCVGTCEQLIEVGSDREAVRYAWETSCTVKEYVTGGYDIYRLRYNPAAHTHILIPVDEGSLFENWNGEVEDND